MGGEICVCAVCGRPVRGFAAGGPVCHDHLSEGAMWPDLVDQAAAELTRDERPQLDRIEAMLTRIAEALERMET